MKNHVKPTELQHREQAEKKWSTFLNGLGLLGYPLGLACLTTKTRAVNAAPSLAFLAAAWSTGRHLKTVRRLSFCAKKTNIPCLSWPSGSMSASQRYIEHFKNLFKR
jgi:hypothetical protein